MIVQAAEDKSSSAALIQKTSKRSGASPAKRPYDRSRSDSSCTEPSWEWNSTCIVRPCVRIPDEECAFALRHLLRPQPYEKAGRCVLSNARSNDYLRTGRFLYLCGWESKLDPTRSAMQTRRALGHGLDGGRCCRSPLAAKHGRFQSLDSEPVRVLVALVL